MSIKLFIIVFSSVVFLDIDFGLFSQIDVMVQSIVIKFGSINFFLLWSDAVSLVEDVHNFDGELDDVLSDLTL